MSDTQTESPEVVMGGVHYGKRKDLDDGKAKTWADFLRESGNDEDLAEAAWDLAEDVEDTAAALGGLSLSGGQAAQQQQLQLQQIRRQQAVAKKAADEVAANNPAGAGQQPLMLNNRRVVINGGYAYFKDEYDRDPTSATPVGEWNASRNAINTEGYGRGAAGNKEEKELSQKHVETKDAGGAAEAKKTLVEEQEAADAAAKKVKETAAKRAKEDAAAAANAQARNTGNAQAKACEADKRQAELAKTFEELKDFVTPEVKKDILKMWGPDVKNRQLADMLMSYATKLNIAARATVLEEKAEKAVQDKKQDAENSLKRARDLAESSTTSAAANLQAAQTAAQAAPQETEVQRKAKRQALRLKAFGAGDLNAYYRRFFPDDDPDEAAAAVAVMTLIEESVLEGIALQLAGVISYELESDDEPEPVSAPKQGGEDEPEPATQTEQEDEPEPETETHPTGINWQALSKADMVKMVECFGGTAGDLTKTKLEGVLEDSLLGLSDRMREGICRPHFKERKATSEY